MPPTIHLPPPLPPLPPAQPGVEDQEPEEEDGKSDWWQRKAIPGGWWPSKVTRATAAGEVVEDTSDEDDDGRPPRHGRHEDPVEDEGASAAQPYAWVVPEELIQLLTPAPPPAPSGDPKRAARIQALIISAIGATVGWFVGLGPGFHHAIVDCGQTTSPSGGVALGIGFFLLTAVVEAVVRSRIPYPIAYWISRGPTATAFLALALYTPNATI